MKNNQTLNTGMLIFEKEGMEANRRDSIAEGFTDYKVAKDLKRLLLEVEEND